MAHHTREEVGEHQTGVAMLVMARLSGGDVGQPKWEPIFESPNTPSPWHAALRLWAVIEDDFPGFEHSVIQNPRSHYLMWAENMRRLLGDDTNTSIDLYLEC